MPRITVIMPFYNVEKYISSAIKSVLAQSYEDWELILVNDGSTDRSGRIAAKFASIDKRVTLLTNPTNLGIARSCNEALRNANGEFIARCDADDLALPERLQKQLEAAEAAPHIGIWGSGAYQIGDRQHHLFLREADPHLTSISLLFQIPIINTTFFARREVLELLPTFYDPAVKFEDYDLMVRLAGLTGMANLRQPLMKIRVNPNSFTYGLTATEYFKNHLHSQEKLLRRLGLDPTNDDLILHTRIVRYVSRVQREWNFNDLLPSLPQEGQVREWFTRILQANKTARIFDQKTLAIRLDEIATYFGEVPASSNQEGWWQSLRWIERRLRPWWQS